MSTQDDYDTQSEFSELSDDGSAIRPTKARASRRNRPTSDRLSRRTPSPDEFEAYDLSEFSIADFAEIDRIVSRMSKLSIPTKGRERVEGGGPAVEIGLEDAEETSDCRHPENSQATQDKYSPYEDFRSSTGVLRVTDITGPAWQVAISHLTRTGADESVRCELQFDYSLRKKRRLSSDDRATSFTTMAGSVITVDQRIASARSKAVTRGTVSLTTVEH